MFLLVDCSGGMQVDRVFYTVLSATPLHLFLPLQPYKTQPYTVSIFSTLVKIPYLYD